MMRKRDSEVISTTSSTSKGSERRKNARFSIRRIFYTSTRSGRTKSRLSLDSDSSVKSEISLNVVLDREREREGSKSTTHSGSQQTLSVPTSVPRVLRGTEKEKECPLCLIDCLIEEFPEISTCYHRSCLPCLRMYLRIEITESRINIACPECSEKFHPNDIKSILQDDLLMSKYEDFMLRRVLVSVPDARWCPAPDCGYAVIASGCAGCPKLKCERPGCDTYFCYHCKQHWHPNQTCDTARLERARDMRSASISYSHDTDSQKDFIKPCPRCAAFIMKMNDGSCNHMTCPVCGAEFCWLCMKEISDLHYLSPSGCTFWGKKPWSRKKKILWQLGTLVGAPVGITLIAGIAVPAMIIGIPVWVGRKIHSKYIMYSRLKRNFAIAGGVSASIILSPVIAGLAVSIGVPILLGYVYGVVPISLCRSGGCGVTTTDGGGVKFEFEDNENGGVSVGFTGDNQSLGTGHHVTNPSIGPSIGEASVGMTNSLYSASGSHMDRVGFNRDESDRESASIRAVAGCSLNGSICGSTYASLGFHSKLEVQADIAEASSTTGKRASFSSESANFSIGEKSLGEKSNMGDDASTKALAGSIVSYKMDSTSITTPSEIQTEPASIDHSKTIHSHHVHHDDRKKTVSCPGSPMSGCGSVCDTDETASGRYIGSKCRKCRRRLAKSAEKGGSEHMNVHFSDQVSLQSFQAEDSVLDLPMGKQGVDTLSEKCNQALDALSDHQTGRDSPLLCMTARMEEEPEGGLSPIRSSDRLSDRSKEQPALSVDSVEDTKTALTKSKSEEIRPTRQEGARKRIRHRSCELAIEHGRISPLTLPTETDKEVGF